MAEKINKDELILQSTSRSHRFSCYEIAEDGTTVLNPATGLPKKLYIEFKNKQYRTKDTRIKRSVLAYVAYHTHEIEKDGKKFEACSLPFRVFDEATLLKLQEPEAVVMKDESGNDVKVSVAELKKAWQEAKAKEVPKEKGEIVRHGTITSKNANLKGGE